MGMAAFNRARRVGESPAPPAPQGNLADMTVAELKELAAARGLAYKPNAKKAELLALLTDEDAEGQ